MVHSRVSRKIAASCTRKSKYGKNKKEGGRRRIQAEELKHVHEQGMQKHAELEKKVAILKR